MAGQAQKKAKQREDEAKRKYLIALGIVNVVYLTLQLFTNPHFFSFYHLLWVAFFGGLEYFLLLGLLDRAKNNQPGGYYFDIFSVTLLAHVVSAFTVWGAAIFLLVR